MAVYCVQLVDGVISGEEFEILPQVEGWDDATILAVKAASAAEHGWAVTWTSDTSFTATKTRWEGGVLCERRLRTG